MSTLATTTVPMSAPPVPVPPRSRPLRLLAVFAHPDDEIGCVGTLAKHARAGGAVKLAWLTRGELASQFGDADPREVARIREDHGRRIASWIGAEHAFFDFADAQLSGGRQEALALARLFAAWRPDRVITWHPFDVHPDHRACYWATLSALKLCRIPKLVGAAHRQPVKLFHYVSPDLPRARVHVDVSTTMDALEQVYAFYHHAFGWPWTLEQLRDSRRRMGTEAGYAFAERFQEVDLAAVEGLPA